MASLAADEGEVLEDGVGPRTPDGDNLVLDYARADAAAFGALVAASGGRVLDDAGAGLHLRDLGSASAFGNPALLTRPVLDGDTEAVVARLRDFYDGQPGGPYLVFSPWRTTDWTVHGFARVGHPPVMFRPAGGTVPGVDGLRVVTVGDASALDDFERTLVEAYPLPELQPWTQGTYVRPAVLDTAWRLFVGYVDDRPVATAAAYLAERVTVVELVSTRPEQRGKGIGAAISAAASLARPDRPSMLIASDDGRPVYERLGYLPLQRYTMWLGLR